MGRKGNRGEVKGREGVREEKMRCEWKEGSERKSTREGKNKGIGRGRREKDRKRKVMRVE